MFKHPIQNQNGKGICQRTSAEDISVSSDFNFFPPWESLCTDPSTLAEVKPPKRWSQGPGRCQHLLRLCAYRPASYEKSRPATTISCPKWSDRCRTAPRSAECPSFFTMFEKGLQRLQTKKNGTMELPNKTTNSLLPALLQTRTKIILLHLPLEPGASAGSSVWG